MYDVNIKYKPEQKLKSYIPVRLALFHGETRSIVTDLSTVLIRKSIPMFLSTVDPGVSKAILAATLLFV